MNNCVSIVLGKEEITLKINEKAKEEEIEKCLEEKIPELKKLYQDEKTPIFVTGKVLKTKEMEMVQTIIQKEIEVNIEFDSPKVLGLHGIKKAFVEEIESSETKFHRGSLRSGKKIEFEGSLVIMGDVNRGAEIIAVENIFVLGILRGMAHAVANGNKYEFVLANEIDVAQIRIANVIKEMEITEEEEQTIKTYAYVKENEIILE